MGDLRTQKRGKKKEGGGARKKIDHRARMKKEKNWEDGV